MQKDGQVVAVLNARQVLVRMLNVDAFKQDRIFDVFEEKTLTEPIGNLRSLEVPKEAQLKVEAIQSDQTHVVMGSWSMTRERVVRRPSALAAMLQSFDQTIEESVEEPVGPSAKIDTKASLKIAPTVAVGIGDYVSAN